MMIRFNRYILLVVFTLLSLNVWGQDKVAFDVEVPSHIIAGRPFRVVFSVNASAKNINFNAPSGLEVVYGPAVSSSSSMSIVNGKRSSSRTTSFTYTLLAEKEGNYVLPEAKVEVSGATYRTASRRITVFGADTDTEVNNGGANSSPSISAEDLYIVAIPSKTQVYEQEAVQITYKLYSRLENTQFSNFSFPDYEGFVQYVQDDGSQAFFEAEQVNGKLYYAATFHSVVLYPQRAGKLVIKPAEFEMVVSMPISNPKRDIFDAFFDNFQQLRKKIKTKPVTIDVKPLPQPNPDNFSGAVGQYSLNMEVPTKVLKTNESFTMKMSLEGKGNIKLAKIPEPIFPEGFDTYDPKESDDTGVRGGETRGTRAKEYFAVPKHVGDFVIPAIPFTYFDPAKGQYETITLPETKVHVDKGEATDVSAVAGLSNKEDVKYLGKDIRYLKGSKRTTTLNKTNGTLYLVAYIALVVLLLVAILIDRKKEAYMADTASNRSRRAGKMARKYLKIAYQMRNKGEDSAYYEALLKGLSDFLSAKLHIPLSELSKENIATAMKERGASDELVEKAIQTLSTLEVARYSPSETEEREQLYDQAASVIDGVQKLKGK